MRSDHEEVALLFDRKVHDLEIAFSLAAAHEDFKGFQSRNR